MRINLFLSFVKSLFAMSQSATLYRISTKQFRMIEKMEAKYIKPSEFADGYVSFQGSFMGLEFILSMGLDQQGRELIVEIFNPTHYIGPTDTNIFNLDSDEEEQFWEMENAVGYLKPNKVKTINEILNNIHEEEITNNYNAEELNANGIYPCSWHEDDSIGKAFNRRQVLDDFKHLSSFIQAATIEDNYVLSYVG